MLTLSAPRCMYAHAVLLLPPVAFTAATLLPLPLIVTYRLCCCCVIVHTHRQLASMDPNSFQVCVTRVGCVNQSSCVYVLRNPLVCQHKTLTHTTALSWGAASVWHQANERV